VVGAVCVLIRLALAGSPAVVILLAAIAAAVACWAALAFAWPALRADLVAAKGTLMQRRARSQI